MAIVLVIGFNHIKIRHTEVFSSSNHSSNWSISDQFRSINGKKYHNEKNFVYFLPNDDEECDRLCLLYYIERCIWQSIFFSPIEDLLNRDGTKVLDVG
ncbi:33117_t:CDS:2 [Racocetra persica]|uniref:33117_t:CDS:1 n=1 Tax=Racocetra persica TaxID=160502 RepID=A0ACA9KHL9_9GLOM|nr:33117_t:CDS:2 [Racocetra persica]